MSNHNYQKDIELFSQLRENFDEVQETAVVAPKLTLSQRLQLRMGSYGTNKRIKALVLRGLLLFMGIVVMSQLFIQARTAVNAGIEGPVPISVAVEQVEDDLLPMPPPPLLLR